MTQESLGKAQAILMIIVVPAALILYVWASIARVRQRPSVTAEVAARGRTPSDLVFACAIGVGGLALTLIGVLQVGGGAGGYAVANIWVGLSIVILVIRRIRTRA